MTELKRKKRKISNCRQKTQEGKDCPGKYILTHDNNAPIFTCEVCGHQDLTWKKFYDEYLQLYKEKINWDEPKNNVSCIIGMFCYLYKEFYSIDYIFVPKNPNPYSSKECRDAWALMSTFNGDVHEARRYIYWIFKRGINKTTTITNFGYILTPGLIRKYKLYAAKKHILTRASKLPEEYISWCKSTIPEIFTKYALETMNDLGALLGYVKHYNINNESVEQQALTKAEQYSLIKEGKLNIGETNEKSNRQ